MDWIKHIEPHGGDLEEQLIRKLVGCPSFMAEVIHLIEADDFYHIPSKLIFRAIEQMWRSGKTINPGSIVEHAGLDRVEPNGATFTSIVENYARRYVQSPPNDVLASDAVYLRGFALLRRLAEFCHATLSNVYDPNPSSSFALEEAREHLDTIKQWHEALDGKQDRLNELRVMPYGEYLRSPEWKARRDAQVATDGNACRVCGSPDNLNVHHRTYERRGCEAPGDLITLCQPCHQLFHDHGKLAKAPD